MCYPETINEKNKTSDCKCLFIGRIASILERSEILRSHGLILNENPDGSNSIKVRILKA